ncbi:hypothetical protein ACJX0J_028352 [Zea mays]
MNVKGKFIIKFTDRVHINIYKAGDAVAVSTSVASKNEGVWVLGFDLQVLAGSDPIYVVLLKYDYSFFFLIKHYGNSFYFSRYKICTKFTSITATNNLEKTLARCFQSEAEGQ